MLTSLAKKKPINKIIVTLIILCIFRLGNTIPLSGLDQSALQKSFFQLESKNSILQIINMYSGGLQNAILTPFSLGILPFINASIFVDLLTALFPFFEKLQSEEGEIGRKTLNLYKKIFALVFAIVQSIFLSFYLSSYFYSTDLIDMIMPGLELVTGSMIVIWLSSLIDTKGIGNGTSIIILTNILITLQSKKIFANESDDPLFFFELGFLLFLMILICISQTIRINIDVVSARQLIFLEDNEKKNWISKEKELKDRGLSIKLNQAGIFPIIIASNLIPFISFFKQNFYVETAIYYLLIIGFNYFYTIVFWDPEKISEQLRKASVSITNITPGKETISYLENVVRSTSIIGGIFLCAILALYEFVKQITNGYVLNQMNISSLIIVVGVAYEIQKNIRSLYKNVIEIV
jgi:preprotein translocase subunit SecY